MDGVWTIEKIADIINELKLRSAGTMNDLVIPVSEVEFTQFEKLISDNCGASINIKKGIYEMTLFISGCTVRIILLDDFIKKQHGLGERTDARSVATYEDFFAGVEFIKGKSISKKTEPKKDLLLKEQLEYFVKDIADIGDGFRSKGKVLVFKENLRISFSDGIHWGFGQEKEIHFRLVRVFYEETKDVIMVSGLFFAEHPDDDYVGFKTVKMG